MPHYRVRLRFHANGPEVIGAWENRDIADRRYREWLGLYGSTPTVALELAQEDTGQVLKSWPPAAV